MQVLDTLPDFTQWEEYKQKTICLGEEIPNFNSVFYRTGLGDETLSAGTFYMRGKLTHIAWGLLREAHCSYHAVSLENGELSDPIAGCPNITLVRENEQPVGYQLDELGKTFIWK